jgi:hypothetical protein
MYAYNCNYNCTPNYNRVDRHDHEFLGSTQFADIGNTRHNHRFSGVTSEAIPINQNHVHTIRTRTDYFGHFHDVIITTGPAIILQDGKHIHFVRGTTTFEDGHVHQFVFATLIEAPSL